jgi:hypothetical protein
MWRSVVWYVKTNIFGPAASTFRMEGVQAFISYKQACKGRRYSPSLPVLFSLFGAKCYRSSSCVVEWNCGRSVVAALCTSDSSNEQRFYCSCKNSVCLIVFHMLQQSRDWTKDGSLIASLYRCFAKALVSISVFHHVTYHKTVLYTSTAVKSLKSHLSSHPRLSSELSIFVKFSTQLFRLPPPITYSTSSQFLLNRSSNTGWEIQNVLITKLLGYVTPSLSPSPTVDPNIPQYLISKHHYLYPDIRH